MVNGHVEPPRKSFGPIVNGTDKPSSTTDKNSYTPTVQPFSSSKHNSPDVVGFFFFLGGCTGHEGPKPSQKRMDSCPYSCVVW